MKSALILLPLFTLAGLNAYSHAQASPNNAASVAGVYSSAHVVTIDGVREHTHGYIEIDPSGHITAYEQQGEGPDAVGGGCYLLAEGTATNAGLQGRLLTPGISPTGARVFQTLAGDRDTFGILAEPGPKSTLRWFFHWGANNSTATVDGLQNVVNAPDRASYSISGPALPSPTLAQLRGMLCRAED